MAGSHFDQRRVEVFDILEHFRFGKQLSAVAADQAGLDPERVEVLHPIAAFIFILTVVLLHCCAELQGRSVPLPDSVLPV